MGKRDKSFMKLKEYLETNPTERLYIGSKSGFFFIGTKTEFMKSCEKLEKKLFNNFKTVLKNAKVNLKLIEKTIIEVESDLEKAKKPADKKQLEKDLSDLNKRLHLKKVSIQYNERAIETFKPLLEREIIYIFNKTTMPDELGIAIKLEGYESGKYWTYQEWIGDKK